MNSVSLFDVPRPLSRRSLRKCNDVFDGEGESSEVPSGENGVSGDGSEKIQTPSSRRVAMRIFVPGPCAGE
jgi:hypothetical protein